MGTNKLASQKGMTSYGTRRHLYDAKIGMDNPLDQSTISLQMGTNKGASQVRRQSQYTLKYFFYSSVLLDKIAGLWSINLKCKAGVILYFLVVGYNKKTKTNNALFCFWAHRPLELTRDVHFFPPLHETPGHCSS